MSAFLGSIHHWLYGKIEFQNGLVERLSDMISKNGYDGMVHGLDADELLKKLNS